MNALERFFRWIETRFAVLFFLLLALAAQVPQVAELVVHIVGRNDWLTYIHAYAFAIAYDGAILIFVTRKKVGLAWAFAVGSMAMNSTHYVTPVLVRHSANLLTPQAIIDMIGAVLLSLATPFALAHYSDVAVEDTASAPMHTASAPIPEVPLPVPPAQPALPATPATVCYTEGCNTAAELCEHGCGTAFCVTHKGAHLRWHCTHNPASRAFNGALIPHAEGIP